MVKAQARLASAGRGRPESLSRAARTREWLLALALLALTAAIYAPTLRHPFVNYDDESYVVENEHIHSGVTFSMLRWAMTSFDQSNWHPITWISHALDCQLFGLNPAGHHATSVLLHGLNAAFLFLLLLRVTGAYWRSLLVAALFALHPLNVESVAWVAERKNVLSMFFLLFTLAAYGWYACKPGALRYFTVAFLFAVGLAAKPMIVTLPCALLLIDYWPLQRIRGWSTPSEKLPAVQTFWAKLLLEKVPLLALSTVSSVITMHAQRVAMPPSEGLPLTRRLANADYSYAIYLWDTVWPTHLSAYYPYAGGHLGGWRVALCVVFLVAITVSAWMLRRSQPYFLVGWLWFLGNLVPVIGLIQVGDQGRADRYVYLPLVGIFVILAWGGSKVLAVSGRHLRPAVIGSAVVVLAGLAVLTVRQIATWRSSYDLWSHALQVTTDNYVAEDYMGTFELVQAYESGQTYSDVAAGHFRNAVRINPNDAIGHLNLGADYHERGQLQQAIEQYDQTLRCTHEREFLTKAYIGLGTAYGQLHQFPRSDEFFRLAMQLEPDNRGLLMRMSQVSMEQKIAQLAEAAATHPSAQNYMQLAQVQQAAGHNADAVISYQQALRLNPKLAVARIGLAGIQQKTKPQ